MSHQVRVRTQIKSLAVLKEALQELGYEYQENGVLCDYRGGKIGNIDLLVKVGTKTSQVGFQLEQGEGTYSLVGDFHQTGSYETEFRKSVMKVYTTKMVKQQVARKRYTVYREEVQANGAVKLYARSMVA